MGPLTQAVLSDAALSDAALASNGDVDVWPFLLLGVLWAVIAGILVYRWWVRRPCVVTGTGTVPGPVAGPLSGPLPR